jgi:cyclohexa-1,5-dienecarbonyl-CoA hydratase
MSGTTAAPKLRIAELEGGALWSVRLDAPRGNVLDARLVAELDLVFRRAARAPALKALLLGAEGSHFSFGASVEEHRRESAAGMLRDFHGMFLALAECAVPVLCAVRGACLGGGLELAAFCHRLTAHPDAKLGQPEIALGVFAPVASAILEGRVGRGAAEDLLLSGRTLDGREALELGLVDALADDPDAAQAAWAREHLLAKSASSLRFAVRAARLEYDRAFARRIAELERLYLGELMATHDAVEGIEAFLARRPPTWRNA